MYGASWGEKVSGLFSRNGLKGASQTIILTPFHPRAMPLVLFLLLAGMGSPQIAQATEPANLDANGDFSQVEKGRPVHWATSGDATVTQKLEAVVEDGKPCAKLVCTRCEGGGGASHAMLAQVGVVMLEQGKIYEFSCRMRAEGLRGGHVNVAISDMNGWAPCGLATDCTVDRSWRECQRVFRATRSVDHTSRLQIWFTEPGTLYVSDVRIAETQVQQYEFTNVVPAAGSKNLVFNGSFEVGPAGWSSLGTRAGWGNLAGLHGEIVESGGGCGPSFLRIPLGGGQTPVMYFDYFEPVVRHELRPLAASIGWIPVEKGAAYTISCDMRGSEEGVPAVLGVHAEDPKGGTKDHLQKIVLAKSWKRYSFTFRPTHRYAFVTVGPNLSEDRKVYVDVDAVQLEKADKVTPFEPRSPVEFGVEPTRPGGIFTQGERAGLDLRVHNYRGAAAIIDIRFEATDFFDRPVVLPGLTMAVAGSTAARKAVALPADWKGYYRVRTRCAAGDGAESGRDLRLAIVPRQTEQDTILGINHAFATSGLIDLARKAGVTWYRDWTLKWQDIEPEPGQFHWEVGDTQLDRVLRQGVHVLPLLPPFPSAYWSTESPTTRPSRDYPAVRLPMAAAPKDPRKLADYVGKAVARYKDRIRGWEFLNEPIYTNYALPGKFIESYSLKQYTPADYVGLLEQVAAAMHRSDPDCKVIGGLSSPPTLLNREAIEAGCLKHVDIFNLHMYPGTRAPEGFIPEMDTLLGLMDENGGRKPIWITEFSYYATDELPCQPFFEAEWSWARLLDSERRCAEYTIRYFVIMLAHGAEKIFLHAGQNPGANQWDFTCCLFADEGAPRKALPALAVFTELMGPSPKCVGGKTFGQAAYCYAFETGKRSVLVYWTTADESARRVTLPRAGVERLDIMGNVMPAGNASTSSAPSEAEGPVYIVGPPGKAEHMLNDAAEAAR